MEKAWELAIRDGDVGGLTRLLGTGADINALNRHGQTGLMIAANEGRTGVVKFLVEHGARLDHTAKYTLSALMLAVVCGHTEIVRILVEAGADLEFRGSGAPGFFGKTALDLAAAQGREDLVELIA